MPYDYFIIIVAEAKGIEPLKEIPYLSLANWYITTLSYFLMVGAQGLEPRTVGLQPSELPITTILPK